MIVTPTGGAIGILSSEKHAGGGMTIFVTPEEEIGECMLG